MGLMLDTSVLVAAERETFDLDALIADVSRYEEISVATMAASELLHGWHRAPSGRRKRQRKRFIEWVFRNLPILDFDLQAARKHAELWAELQSRGQMIGAHDLIIAATCLSAGHRLATLNLRDFRRVPGMQLVEVDSYIVSV